MAAILSFSARPDRVTADSLRLSLENLGVKDGVKVVENHWEVYLLVDDDQLAIQLQEELWASALCWED